MNAETFNRDMKAYHDSIFEAAVAAGCQPFWYDGLVGWAWHCGCDDLRHASDQQCSTITIASAKRGERA